MSNNPYAPPESPILLDTTSDAEAVRKEHIKHEASVKSIGFLYWLAAVALVLSGVALLLRSREAADFQRLPLYGGLLLVLGVLLFLLGTGLRQLKKWARIPAGIWAGVGLLGFPLGTLINAYILYLICCKKGSVVFSDAYKQVIQQTPHVKYKTSILIWLLLILLILVAFGAYAAYSKR